jgi:hypothetical protein
MINCLKFTSLVVFTAIRVAYKTFVEQYLVIIGIIAKYRRRKNAAWEILRKVFRGIEFFYRRISRDFTDVLAFCLRYPEALRVFPHSSINSPNPNNVDR